MKIFAELKGNRTKFSKWNDWWNKNDLKTKIYHEKSKKNYKQKRNEK